MMDLKALAEAVRQEGIAKQFEARDILRADQGEAFIAKQLTRRAANLLAAAAILERISNWRGLKRAA